MTRCYWMAMTPARRTCVCAASFDVSGGFIR